MSINMTRGPGRLNPHYQIDGVGILRPNDNPDCDEEASNAVCAAGEYLGNSCQDWVKYEDFVAAMADVENRKGQSMGRSDYQQMYMDLMRTYRSGTALAWRQGSDAQYAKGHRAVNPYTEDK